MVDPELKKFRSFDAPDQFLLELLHGFSQKSEADLLLVIIFLKNKIKTLSENYPATAGQLAWHAEQIGEKFRSAEIKRLIIAEIKSIIQPILN